MQRHLLIVADDFGYGNARDHGILKCFQKNCISGVSILPNCKHSYNAVQIAKKHNLPTGLHFNITEGQPLSNADSVSSLVGPSGKFLGKLGFWSASNIVQCHVALELETQIDWFRNKFGYLPLHIDGHQHVHVHPDVVLVFSKTLSNFRIKRTRLPIEYPCPKLPVRQSFEKEHFLNKVTRMAEQAARVFKEHQVCHTEAFIGMYLMGKNMSIESLQCTINQVFQSGVGSCELMVHPGYCCDPVTDGCLGDEFADAFSCSPDREHELNVLTSDEMINFYKINDIKLSISAS
ncbi:carbohydrate deacetylase-like [Clavelina lepadiformis]|uniref:carbohydrate deacetylase-like n=1 Tax=Clavelina lepadiformis TaxID=159417 RepID=UPI00404255AA